MNLKPTDCRKLETLLAELLTVIEDSLRTGLTTASETTRQTLHITFQEASRLRLLRLGSTLRMANDEMGKLIKNDADFSRSRFVFFLHRAWMLARGLLKALQANDEAAFDNLLWTPQSSPVARLEVAVLGVLKKVVPRTFVAFDFRLRVVVPTESLPMGQRVSWSCVFPLKPDQDIPAEAFLHLPQKQKFTAAQFLESKTMVFENVAVAMDNAGGARLTLGDQSTVRTGSAVKDYGTYLSWDVATALERIEKHEPSPFELDVEMEEEVVLRDWTVGEMEEREAERQVWYKIIESGVALTGVASAQDDGKALRKSLEGLRAKKPEPLYGLMHYEKCRLMFRPLTLFGGKGPTHLMLSPDKVDRATLLQALKF